LQFFSPYVKVSISSDCTFVSEIHVQEAPRSGVPAFRQFFQFFTAVHWRNRTESHPVLVVASANFTQEGSAMAMKKDQTRDISSKDIFGNHELCAQFLRNFVGEAGAPFLKNVRPEDIEDYSMRHHFFSSVELNSDTVKRVRLRDGEIQEFFVALIEHKSDVDYDIAMQLLQYMVCIWYDWVKAEEARLGKKGLRKRKQFHYPPILPIVYYEGTGSWDSVPELKERVLLSEVFSAYIPNFRYILIQNRAFSKDELLDRNDEMSLLMLINKIQDPDDLKLLQDIPAEKMNSMVAHSSEAVLNVIAAAVQALCRKFTIPDHEVSAFVGKVKERKMGYLWENMRTVDIQAERLKAQEAEEKLNAVQKKLNAAEEQLNAAEEQLNAAEEQLNATEEQLNATEEQLNATEEQLSTAETERDEARSRIEKAEKERDSAKKDLDRKEEENQRLREQLAQAEVRLKQLLETK